MLLLNYTATSSAKTSLLRYR